MHIFEEIRPPCVCYSAVIVCRKVSRLQVVLILTLQKACQTSATIVKVLLIRRHLQVVPNIPESQLLATSPLPIMLVDKLDVWNDSRIQRRSAYLNGRTHGRELNAIWGANSFLQVVKISNGAERIPRVVY